MSTILGEVQLSFQFFKLFAQYESSLKENGFFTVDKTGRISVDWDKFANEKIGKNFKEKLGKSLESALYIFECPPKIQMYDGVKIVWSPVSNNEKSIQILFGHICRVRNNLFHGAKFNGTWNEPERSERLLSCALDILITIHNQLPIKS